MSAISAWLREKRMAVLVEGFSVVVRREAIERKFPGGMEAYVRQRLNDTYCADDRLCRVSFTVGADARAYVRQLVAAGIEGPAEGPSPDFAVVNPVSGHLVPCDWLELEVRWHSADGETHGVTVAKLPGDHVTGFAVPGDWRPGQMTKGISATELAANYEAVKIDHLEGGGIVETYRHRETGDLIFMGRPDVARVQQRLNELLDDYGQIERMRPAQLKTAAAAFLKRVTQLVEDTGSEEPAPLQLQGMAARLLGRWEIAEQAFRKVTTLRPTLVSAWHDLTWALASLGRLEEAETTARHALHMSPDDPASLGNLASALRERGKLDEALTTIERALQVAPGNKINETILDQIRKDQGIPWYKRLFFN
jgi:hypothetical protein